MTDVECGFCDEPATRVHTPDGERVCEGCADALYPDRSLVVELAPVTLVRRGGSGVPQVVFAALDELHLYGVLQDDVAPDVRAALLFDGLIVDDYTLTGAGYAAIGQSPPVPVVPRADPGDGVAEWERELLGLDG